MQDDWQRLIGALDAWTPAAGVAPGQIQVTLHQDETSRQVLIVMTPEEWDDMVRVMWGNFDDALDDVKRTLKNLRPEERFAVYSLYRLKPSVEPDLTERTPGTVPGPGGEWVASDRDGRMTRFADWSDPDEPS